MFQKHSVKVFLEKYVLPGNVLFPHTYIRLNLNGFNLLHQINESGVMARKILIGNTIIREPTTGLLRQSIPKLLTTPSRMFLAMCASITRIWPTFLENVRLVIFLSCISFFTISSSSLGIKPFSLHSPPISTCEALISLISLELKRDQKTFCKIMKTILQRRLKMNNQC